MYIKESLLDSQSTLERFVSNEKNIELIDQATQAFVKSLNAKGKILACGNGGSMCDSMHFVEELTGRYRKDRDPISAISMGDPGHLTCVSNDYGYDYVFSRLVQAWGNSGDCLLAISTSGNSKNVIEAVNKAKELGMKSIGLLGKTGGELKELVDFPIVVESDITDRIQEIHIKIIHIFIEGIERQLFPSHYN